MQTFLPYADFAATAQSLDRARLGKQRLENVQILRAMVVPGAGYAYHPATLMWTDWKALLYRYHLAIIHEWVNVRGYKDTRLVAFEDLILPYFEMNPDEASETDEPLWLGDWGFHAMHQSKLIQKDPEFYGPQFPGIPDNLEFVWPR